MRSRLPSLVLLLVLVGVLGLHNPAFLANSDVVGAIIVPPRSGPTATAPVCKDSGKKLAAQRAGRDSRDGDDAIPQQNLKYLGRLAIARLRSERVVKPTAVALAVRPVWVTSQGNLLRKRILKKSR